MAPAGLGGMTLRAHGDIYLNHYAAGRIIFKAKGSDSKFGALQAPATNKINLQDQPKSAREQ
jgi:hypothetical protein